MSEFALFKTQPAIERVSFKRVGLEKEIQHLVEDNMEQFFGVRFIKTEHTIHHDIQDGRIDSLGIDENGCPVIFEYKREASENVINQGLFYLDWLVNHKADFKLLTMEKLGQDAAEAIDWSSPSVYCIAYSFGKYDEFAVKQMNLNIKLIRYAKSENTVLFEFLNSPSTDAAKGGGAISTSEGKTYREQYNRTSSQLREVVDEVRSFMLSLGNDVSENELKLYLAIRKSKNIVCIEVNKTKVTLHLRIDADTIEETELVSDARNKGHWGTGDVEISLRTLEEMELIKPLLERAYYEN